MGKFRVRFGRYAREDLESILNWGIGVWGADSASRWLDELEKHVRTRLSESPLAYSIAPEDAEFDFEVRQLIYDRYRVLFSFDGDEVLVLRVRGPYSANSPKLLS